MTPLDADMDDAMQRWAAKHKLERVASYRQLQGYSNQLRAMTMYCGPPLTIHSFKLPAGFNVRPVGSNEERATVRGEHQDVSYIVNKTSRALTPILPVAKVIVRLLTLGLDQGSVGLGGSSFAQFHMRYMIFAKFDKIHRLVRDIKFAENGCCKKIFTKAKLWSAYLFSLNKRPFGSGANTTMKQRLMWIFQQRVCDTYHAVFQKYLPKLGKMWNMPYTTVEEQQAILDAVYELPSFCQHLNHPKLANWFAWNKSANEQIGEFHAAKMVYEVMFDDQADPDAKLHYSNVLLCLLVM